MIKIGTRGSQLALYQANMVKKELLKKDPSLKIQIIPIKTEGDIKKDAPISEISGRGVFCKEIQLSLLRREIDICVHSLKDVPSQLNEELYMAAVLKRDDHRDVLIKKDKNLLFKDIKTIGTGSIRRKKQLEIMDEDFKILDIRGNIQKRLEYLNKLDAIIISNAAIKRLKLEEKYKEYSMFFKLEEMVPSPAQGVIVAEIIKNSKIRKLVESINHKQTYLACKIERRFLKTFGYNCTIPVGAYFDGKHLYTFVEKEYKKVEINKYDETIIDKVARELKEKYE